MDTALEIQALTQELRALSEKLAKLEKVTRADVIRTTRVELVDKAGCIRGDLGVTPAGPELRMFDEVGKLRVRLWAEDVYFVDGSSRTKHENRSGLRLQGTDVGMASVEIMEESFHSDGHDNKAHVRIEGGRTHTAATLSVRNAVAPSTVVKEPQSAELSLYSSPADPKLMGNGRNPWADTFPFGFGSLKLLATHLGPGINMRDQQRAEVFAVPNSRSRWGHAHDRHMFD